MGDFSQIRNASLGRFRAERPMAILNRLGERVEVNEMENCGSCGMALAWGPVGVAKTGAGAKH
jgi:hypothetical protein